MSFFCRRTTWLLLVCMACAAFGAGCGKRQVVKKSGVPGFAKANPSQCFQVVNGIVDTDIPAVVQITTLDQTGLCTGTFVGDNVVFTAAHCMDTTALGGMGLSNGTMPVSMVHGGVVGENALSARPLEDFAILIFPAATSKSWRKIATSAPKAGDAMVVAGYGQTDFINNNASDGKVRYGFNVVDSVSVDQAILKYQSKATTDVLGQDSMSGRGDSGGPIFSGDGQVALTSGGSAENGVLFEDDFYLFSSQALEVIERAEAQGAHINGVNHIRKALGVTEKQGALDTDTVDIDIPSC